MPINRLAAFVLGPIITLAAGAIAAVGAKYGLHIPETKAAGALTTGAVIIAPMVLSHLKIQKWLDGYQKWEQRADDATNGQLDATMNDFLATVATKVGVPLPGAPAPLSANVVGQLATTPAIPTDDPAATEGQGSAGAGTPPPVAQPGAFEGANAPGA